MKPLLLATLLCVLCPVVVAFRIGKLRRAHTSVPLRMGIDVSGLSLVPVPPELMAEYAAVTQSSGDGLGVNEVQNALILASGLVYFAYESRPRGGARTDLLEVRRSSIIPGASTSNRGVFSKGFIPAGTLLGTFPGFVKKADSALASKQGEKAKQLAKKYMWALNEDTVLDPTNDAGSLNLEIRYFYGIVKVDTMMARINEPPPRNDCNVYTKVTGTTVEVFAERDLFADEELFIDYGMAYDRSDYDDDGEALKKVEAERVDDQRRANQKRADEDAMMRLQPIVAEEGEEGAVDQDTSRPDGFIRRLSQREEGFKKAGILTPEEGANIFSELGARGLGVNKEDLELMQSLSGKGGKKGGGKGSFGGAKSPEVPKEQIDRFDQGVMDSLLGGKGKFAKVMGGAGTATGAGDEDDELLDGLRSQMGEGRGEDSPDLIESMEDMFGGVKGEPASSPNAKASEPQEDKEEAPSTMLSKDEAEDLQRRLDNMTDEQVEQVFAKLRTALSDKMKSDLEVAIEKNKADKGLKTMPRAAVNDPAVRSKYSSELNSIENELEKMYSDPLGVWSELMANPDKYSPGPPIKEGDVADKLGSDEPLA